MVARQAALQPVSELGKYYWEHVFIKGYLAVVMLKGWFKQCSSQN
jgi:hypothetical protein